MSTVAEIERTAFTGCDFTGSTLTFVNTWTANGLTVMTGAVLTDAAMRGIVTHQVVGWEGVQL